MKIEVRDAGQVRILDLTGKLFLGEPITVLEKAMNATLTEEHKRIVINLDKTPSIDSAGTGAMAVCYKRACDKEAKIKLIIPPASQIPLHVQTCLRLLFETFDDEVKAVASFVE